MPDGLADTEELLVRVGRGDQTARSRLLDRHRDRLRRMVVVRLDHRVLARLDPSDIVQDALVEADRKLADFVRERPVPFYPWLRRLAWEHLVRLHRRHLRARRRSVLREAASLTRLPDESAVSLAERLAAPSLAPDHRLLEAELKARVKRALNDLPERDREVLVMRYLEDLSNSEIAVVLGISEGAVRTRHTRALDRIAKHVNR
jgi:RNA polymerase sigma-70 factor (ECF subfamily)